MPTKTKLTAAWKMAARNLGPVGSLFKAGAYRLVGIDAGKRFRFERVATGKPVTITATILDRVYAETADGGTVLYRTNGPGGINYTIANQLLVVTALGLKPIKDEDGKKILKWER